jgi:hypothetical protein
MARLVHPPRTQRLRAGAVDLRDDAAGGCHCLQAPAAALADADIELRKRGVVGLAGDVHVFGFAIGEYEC